MKSTRRRFKTQIGIWKMRHLNTRSILIVSLPILLLLVVGPFLLVEMLRANYSSRVYSDAVDVPDSDVAIAFTDVGIALAEKLQSEGKVAQILQISGDDPFEVCEELKSAHEITSGIILIAGQSEIYRLLYVCSSLGVRSVGMLDGSVSGDDFFIERTAMINDIWRFVSGKY